MSIDKHRSVIGPCGRIVLAANQIFTREKGVGSSWFERSIEHLYRGESGSGFKVLK